MKKSRICKKELYPGESSDKPTTSGWTLTRNSILQLDFSLDSNNIQRLPDVRPTTIALYFNLSINKISHNSKSERIGAVTPTVTKTPRHNTRKGCKWTDADQSNHQPAQAHPKTGHLPDPMAGPARSQITSPRSRTQQAQSHLHPH